MTSYMTIMVRVVSNRAQAQLAALRAQQAGLTSGIAAANRQEPIGRRHITSLMKFGNQLQWTGRMLQYNFTLPIVAAGAAATFFAMEQEKAFVHVAKVYGDTQEAARQFRREMGLGAKEARKLAESYKMDELEALDDAFTAISEHYGVQKKEVNEVAGAWAAAGASGRDLAESVNQTMQAIIIGDMNAMTATKALISIQAQYNLSTKELQATLANLNSVENQTGASMSDLIIGFEKAAGVARSAGVETQQLAAYMAALVPATGSASTAGNALKTIMSRLMAPTKEASQVMEAMGLNISSLEWQSATVTERLAMMATEFEGLGKAAQNSASSVIASRWQINRFEVLMRELVSTTGYYQKALDAAENQGESFRRMQEELNTVLESDPRRLQRMWVMLQNASVEIIQPLIPHIIWLAQSVANLAKSFANLDPEVQKLVLIMLLLLAAIGPVIRYMGAMYTLLGVLGHGFVIAFHGARKFGGAILGLLTPFKMLGTAAMGALGLVGTAVAGIFGGVASVLTGMFSAAAAISIRGWAIQVGIWKAGIALQLLNLKLFYLSAMRFWVAVSIGSATRWAAMWTAIKVISIAAMGSHIRLLGKFQLAVWRIWTTTLLVTTNIWGRIAVAMMLFAKKGVVGVLAIFKGILPFLMKWGKFLVSPWGIAILAITGLLYAFRDQIAQIWNNIVSYMAGEGSAITQVFQNIGNSIIDVFNMLPESVQNALVAVVTVIREAALAVYEWFQYINPFARHSPSLVENVTTGMKAVVGQFAKLGQIKKYTSAAYAEIKKFSELTSKLGLSVASAQQAADRKSLKKAGAGGALASYDRLTKIAGKLTGVLRRLEGAIAGQEKVVDRWQKKVDQANAKLERQQDKLQKLQDKLQKYQDKLSQAESDLDYFASAPLKGMRAMEDQIFANQMAQTKLRLEMMNMEDAVGTFDDLKEKIEAANGMQELFRGTQSSLRAAGAGSEILSQYDNEINKLEEQKGTYNDTIDTMNKMQIELEKLQREAERLDLVKAMKFDELQYQIARAADNMQELSFEEIMSGIGKANDQIAKYTPLVEEATQAVADQQLVVDNLTAARDKLQERLDSEEAKLTSLRDKYGEVNDALSAINSTINDIVTAAEKMNDALDKKKDAKKNKDDAYISPGLQNFLNAGKATFEDPGGMGIPPRTDWSNQADSIKKFTEQLGMDTAAMFGDLNPFAPIKEKAAVAWEWVKNKASKAADKIKEFFGAAFDGISLDGGSFDKVKNTLETIVEFITGVAKDIGKVFGWAYDLLWPEVKKIGKGVWDGLKSIWEKVGPKLAEFKDLWGPIGEAISNLWTILKPILAVLVGGLLLAVKSLLSAIGEAVGPALEAIGTILGGLIDLVKGVVKVLVGIFTADFGMVLSGLGDIFTGIWDIVWGTLSGMVSVVWNLIQGFVKGIVGFFEWLYDILVGHSIVPDLVDKIIDTFQYMKNLAQWVWKNVLKPIWEFFVELWEKLSPELAKWWNRVTNAWNLLKTIGTWFWTHVLKPVWDLITDLWDNKVKPEFEKWRGRIEFAWNLLKALGTWFWNNILKPVWDTIKGLWEDHVRPELHEWRTRIETAWNALTRLGNWITNNVMDPIKSAFTTGWQAIKTWFQENADILTKPVGAVVNTVIGAVNTMIRGLNKVADVLPGIDWEIGTITPLAQGGPIPTRRVGNGFMTRGARAIVGEGKANHPEFVIPTDPTHRNRARALLTMAASKIGMGPGVNSRGIAGDTAGDIAAVLRNNGTISSEGIPQYGIGGWLSDQWGDLKGVAKQLADLPQNAVGAIMDPALNYSRGVINGIGWPPVEAPPEYALNKLEDWIKGANNTANKKAGDADDIVSGGPQARAALDWAKTQVGKPYVWGGVGPDGYDCSGFMSAIANIMLGRDPHSRLGATATFPWAGFSYGVKNKGFNIGSARNYGGTGIGHMAGTLAGVNVESAGGVGVRVGSAARGVYDSGFNTKAHLNMKYGGVIRARRGGTLVRAGEAGRDEMFTPLPHNWKNDGVGGKKEYHFHGDLSFPNITDPNDAELFIQNLENLAED